MRRLESFGPAALATWVIVALVGTLVGAAAEATPRLERRIVESQPEVWVLTGLPATLAEPEVKGHLTTGLTTSFVFRLSSRDAQGRRIRGVAQVQVRYDLWDEIFHVATLGFDGQVERTTLEDPDALHTWWKTLRLVVLDAARVDLRGSANVRLTLEVVPFSRSEQRDAQRWFSESLERSGRSSAEEMAESADDQPERLSRAINLLLATSIQRNALATYHFTLLRPPEEPRP